MSTAQVDAALLRAVTSAPPSLDASLLSESPDDALSSILPLLLAGLSHVSDRDVLRDAVTALRARLVQSRVLRARFLLHVEHPALASFWSVENTDEERDIDLGEFDDDELEMLLADQPDDEEFMAEREMGHPVKQVVLTLPADDVDMATKEFWMTGVHAQDIEEDHVFEVSAIANPLFRATEDGDGGGVGDSVVVRKVFSSIARPIIVQVLAGDDDDIDPGLLVKHGDNLLLDLGVQNIFQLLNLTWAEDEDIGAQFGTAPVALWYDVVPTGLDAGLMEAVSGLSSLKDFDWEEWRQEVEGDDDAIMEMVRSAVGGYIATYIVGGRDRHFDNILIRDSRRLLHIDFTYILGGGPPLDAPPIAVASEMEDAFQALGVWETFVGLCGAAFISARHASGEVLRLADMVFGKSGMKRQDIQAFLRGNRSLNLGEADEDAGEHVMEQVRNSGSNAQTWMKRISHEYVDPAWYGLLKKGFPPAVAIMDMLDKSENAAAQELADQLAAEAAAVKDEERLDVE